MPSTATTRNRLEKQAPGENANTWGDRFNQNFADLLDDALDGMVSFSLSGSKTLTDEDFAEDEARHRYLNVTGGTGGTVTIPNLEKIYLVRNASSADVTFTTGSGTTAVVKSGNIQWIVCEAGNVVRAVLVTNFGSANLTTTGTLAAGATTITGNFSNTANATLGDGTSDAHTLNGDVTITNGLTVGRDAVGAGAALLFGSSPLLVLRDSNTAGAGATGGIEYHDSASVVRAHVKHGATSGTLDVFSANTLTLSGPSATVYVTITSAGFALTNHGTTASAANAFIATSGGLVSRSTSSARYKTHISDMPAKKSALVLNLRPITYRSAIETDDPKTIHWGLIAEEVAEILPELVHFNGEGAPESVQYERIVVGLLAEHKKLADRVAALEAA